MKVKHVHQGYPSTWEVTIVERKKNKLYVDKFENDLAFRITTCISMLKKQKPTESSFPQLLNYQINLK